MSTPTSKDSLESVVESNQDSDERTTVKAIENFLRDKFNTARVRLLTRPARKDPPCLNPSTLPPPADAEGVVRL